MTKSDFNLHRALKNKNFNTNIGSAKAQKYVEEVRPARVRTYASKVIKDIQPGIKGVRHAAALNQHVFHNIDYETTSDVWRADFVLEKRQKGDCEDLSVVMASLLESQGFDWRYVILSDSEDADGHLMLQVFFDAEFQQVQNELNGYYDPNLLSLYHEENSDGVWVFCDPVNSPYLGVCSGYYFDSSDSGKSVLKDGFERDNLNVTELEDPGKEDFDERYKEVSALVNERL